MAVKEVKLPIEKWSYLVKVAITYLFMGLAGWAIVLLLDEEEEPWGCSADSEKLCTFKKVAAGVSCLLLLPFWFESNYQGFKVALSWIDDDGLEFLSDDTQGLLARITGDHDDGGLIFALFVALFGPIFFILLVLYLIIIDSGDLTPCEGILVLFYYIFGIMPDWILAYALFPLSVLVILSSQTVGEVLINLVAMQIFAQLDDILVKMIVRPDLSNGQVLLSYVKSPKLEENNKVTPTVEP